MENVEAVRGKKIALEVNADDAAMLRERGKDFFNALHGKTIQTNDQVLFGQMLLVVESTKPKGMVRIGPETKVKISITDRPLRQSCASCAREQPLGQTVCVDCGAVLPVVKI